MKIVLKTWSNHEYSARIQKLMSSCLQSCFVTSKSLLLCAGCKTLTLLLFLRFCHTLIIIQNRQHPQPELLPRHQCPMHLRVRHFNALLLLFLYSSLSLFSFLFISSSFICLFSVFYFFFLSPSTYSPVFSFFLYISLPLDS